MPFPDTSRFVWFIAVGGGTTLVAAASGLILRIRGRIRYALLALPMGAMLASPLLVPRQAMILRCIAAGIAGALCFKIIDILRLQRSGRIDGDVFREYLGFLANPLALTLAESRRRLPSDAPRGPELRRLALALPFLIAGAVLLYVLVVTGFGKSSFLIDHVTKVVALGLIIEPFCQIVCAVGRLSGWDVRPVVDFAFLSRTPAEFWRRYNRMVGVWLHRNVYIPAGGRQHPVRATLLTFFVSGVGHEYLFSMALSAVYGYQVAFFMVQAVGVIASAWLCRRPDKLSFGGRVVAHAATMAFVVFSLILFFASVAKMAPGFYSAQPWLR